MKNINILFIVLLFSGSAIADEYTDALEAEATGLSVDNESGTAKPEKASRPKSEWSSDQQRLGEGIPKNLGYTEFVKMLKQSYFGSYIFFGKLTKLQSISIYEMYLKGTNIEVIRENIMNYYRKNI